MHPWTSHEQAMENMIELESLVNTYWSLVVEKTYQKKSHPDYHTYIWNGKLEEIITQMLEDKTDLLIIGNQLKSSQIFHIVRMFEKNEIEVWDRVDLILKIFEKHAVSAESKLQIELAAIKHMWPRIFWMWMELSRQWWWASGGKWAARWIWETNTERMRRHLKDKELEIRKKLKEYAQTRSLHRVSRQRKWLQTIWIVGYTNAGKSTLFNALCNKKVLAEDKLFATLGTHVGKMFAETDHETGLGKELLINDTIGFIQDLPPELIDAFASTLEDSIESDILLHVIDANDPKIQMKMQVVNDILDKIWANQQRILVFNKIDLVGTMPTSSDNIYEVPTAVADIENADGLTLPETENINILDNLKLLYPEAIFVSAWNGVWINKLKEQILKIM